MRAPGALNTENTVFFIAVVVVVVVFMVAIVVVEFFFNSMSKYMLKSINKLCNGTLKQRLGTTDLKFYVLCKSFGRRS